MVKMKKLEDALKYTGRCIGTGLLVGSLVASPLVAQHVNAQTKSPIEYKTESKQKYGLTIDEIKQIAKERGYVTLEEFQIPMQYLKEAEVAVGKESALLETSDSKKAINFLTDAIKNDLLPFKPMFYLSLEKKDYDGAELIRRSWINNLNYLNFCFSRTWTKNPEIKEKVGLQLEKLNTVGLTDPILITLREELITAIKYKKWDDAHKIQNIITGRVKELQPEQGYTEKKSLEDKMALVEQQTQKPSEQYLQIEQIPRYGATDVARAVSLIKGKGGMLSDKETGALKLLDILLKR